MNELKNFLESRGPALASLEEILPYYALPYIPNPIGHKGFKDLFTMGWLGELKLRIGNFVREKKHSTASTVLDKMYQVYIEREVMPRRESPKKQEDPRVQELEREVRNLKRENEELLQASANNSWESQCKELYQITKEFSKLLQLSLTGKSVNESLSRAAYEKLARFDKTMNKSSPEIVEASPQPSFFKSGEIRLIKGYSYLPPINYASIIRDLSTLQDDIQVCAILQALR